MKPSLLSLVVAGVALLGGALGGVLLATRLDSGRDVATRRQGIRPVPQLVVENHRVAERLDRRLLRLADTEAMRTHNGSAASTSLGDAGVLDGDVAEPEPETRAGQLTRLYRLMVYELGIKENKLTQIRSIIETLPYTGQGNPKVTVHLISREQCRASRAATIVARADDALCGAPNMVALFDPEREEPAQSKLCIDQFEFPNIPCEYPLVWVRASDAARICRVLDKRLCDAHEWEGACAGKILPVRQEYENYMDRLNAEYYHNQHRQRVWAMGYQPDARTCGTGALKSPGCGQPSWEYCGSNTYPAGAFPRCVSPFGVYDLHGNVAEHMNLPLNETQLGVRGGTGQTEMKGSWFGFDAYHPHADDCRWRAPAWHATPLMSETSHFNYHLGFRCCRDLE